MASLRAPSLWGQGVGASGNAGLASRPKVWWGRVTPRAANQAAASAACRHASAPGPTGTPCNDCVEYRRALTWISGYWLGPTAVCQVHVDHMKGIARRALGEPYV